MFNLKLTYENDCRAEELEPIKADIISGKRNALTEIPGHVLFFRFNGDDA